MNVTRAKIAIEDLLDCIDIYYERCLRRGFVNEGDDIVRIGNRIHNRFNEIRSGSRSTNVDRVWAMLHQSLERCAERSSRLRKINILDKEEDAFVKECLEEVHKYIRRYFAKKEKPAVWRRGA